MNFQNTMAEYALLSALIHDFKRYEYLLGEIKTGYFGDAIAQQVLASLKSISQQGLPVNLVSLCQYGLLQDANSKKKRSIKEDDLREILAMRDAINLADALELVKDAFARRSLHAAAQAISESASDPDLSGSDAVQQALSLLSKIETGSGGQLFVPIVDAIESSFRQLEDRCAARARGEDGCTIMTGFRKLDEMTGGFEPGQMNLLAARPSVGKTGLGLQIARNVAQSGVGVAYLSMEMSKEQLIQRLAGEASGVSSLAMRRGELNQREWDAIVCEQGRLALLPLHFSDFTAVTPGKLQEEMRRLKREDPNFRFLVIDYLQLMENSTNGNWKDNRVQEVSQISRTIKKTAMDLGICVLALSQLSRGVESRQDKRPLLSDLRESGSLEQDADMVMMLYREGYHDRNAKDTYATELIVAKQRNGPTGTVHLTFVPRIAGFIDAY